MVSNYAPINTPNFIDLFAGCGGLSLGLEQAGFSPVFVNEIDNDALETYLINRDQSFPYLRNPKFHSNDIKDCISDAYLAKLKSNLKNILNVSEVDLICGGPPCQGFSGLGLRRSYSVEKKDIPSNHLYEDMALFIKGIKPKIFLFENVQGLLSSRWSKQGVKGEVFESVVKTFKSIPNYSLETKLIFSKDYGVPQRRPRVFIIGVRNDLVTDNPLNNNALNFFPKGGIDAPSIPEILSDLVDTNYMNGGKTSKYPHDVQNEFQEYFRTLPCGNISSKGDLVDEHEYSKHSQKVIDRFEKTIRNEGAPDPNFMTKKFAQRMLPKQWSSKGPNLTLTSMPDDFIHYAQPRSPTLRECARLQTFPDHYKFSGKRTTGGTRRAGVPTEDNYFRELPKFTQIGNAVPVWLGREIGKHFKGILES